MHDDVFCLFVVLAAMLALSVPSAARGLFAVFACGLALAAHLVPKAADAAGPTRHSGSGIAGP
jgi:hypothetical protein